MSSGNSLYTFGFSVWGAAPELALIELGYGDSIERKNLNENQSGSTAGSLSLAFPNAMAAGTSRSAQLSAKQLYTDNKDLVAYLVRNKNGPATEDHSFFSRIPKNKHNPSFALLFTRNELNDSDGVVDLPGSFLQHNQSSAAPLLYLTTDGTTPQSLHSTDTPPENSGLFAIYNGKLTDTGMSFEHTDDDRQLAQNFILNDLTKHISSGMRGQGKFIGGATLPGEEDYHAAAWLTMIVTTAGATTASDAMEKLGGELGRDVPRVIREYWSAWTSRESWNQVYNTGLY